MDKLSMSARIYFDPASYAYVAFLLSKTEIHVDIGTIQSPVASNVLHLKYHGYINYCCSK